MCGCVLVVCMLIGGMLCSFSRFFFFQAEDGIRDLVRSRGLGDVYKRQHLRRAFGHVYGESSPKAQASFKEYRQLLLKAEDLSLIHI